MSLNPDIKLSAAAQDYLAKQLAAAGKQAVRLSLKQAGCSGYEYVIDYADQPEAGDMQKQVEGFSLYVDGEAYHAALAGLHIDYQQDMLSSGLVFDNPNQTGECGCGKSFSV